MKRREFLGGAVAAGALWPRDMWGDAPAEGAARPAEDVKTVLVMFKCHFDLGFIDTQAGVAHKYFTEYFPHAIEIANTMRDSGGDHYVWTTGSWLLYEYLEQADGEARRRMEQAIARGDIAWHALPFSWQSELLDPSMMTGAIGLSKSLDTRFGHTTTGAKMTDVPGHTRGLVGPLASGGVKLLDIGVNSASTPPDVPELFIWRDSNGRSVIVMYHHKAYGGVVRVPGSDLAVAIEVADDNKGPHKVEEIRTIYAELRGQFPKARIVASNLTEIANAVSTNAKNLPVVTQEIGDTWIYGVPSDPVKVVRYREMARLRRSWIERGAFQMGDKTDVALLRKLALAVEHTWGTDTKTWLDFDHYTPKELAQMLDRPNYQTVKRSWAEKRDDIDQGVQALPAPLQQEASARLADLKATGPKTAGMKALEAGEIRETRHFIVKFDSRTGALTGLRNKAAGREWASERNPLALFAYQTLSKEDYDRFLDAYVTSKADWAPKDFGKPNIGRIGAESRTWFPKVKACWSESGANGDRVVMELVVDDETSWNKGLVAWPRTMYSEVVFPASEAAIHLNFSWAEKPASRMPEALWLTFQPDAADSNGWVLDKAGQQISPLDVVAGGNRHMHAIASGIKYKDARGSFSIESVDAPVLALGERNPIYFSRDLPDLAKGLHFSLYNNGWGTNYIQWFGEDVRFRFLIRA